MVEHPVNKILKREVITIMEHTAKQLTLLTFKNELSNKFNYYALFFQCE